MIADVIEQVVFVRGRILHGGTGLPVIGSVRVEAKEGRVFQRLLDDGTFVISGRTDLLFPTLSVNPSKLTLRIIARSTQWAAGKSELALAPIVVPAGHDFAAPGGMLTAPATPATAPAGTILLPADAVFVRGRVVRVGTPDTDVVGGTVQIIQSTGLTTTATTGPGGRYAFAPLQIEPGARIRASVGTTTEERALLVDYASAVNEENFRLRSP